LLEGEVGVLELFSLLVEHRLVLERHQNVIELEVCFRQYTGLNSILGTMKLPVWITPHVAWT